MSERNFVKTPSGTIAYQEQGAGPVALFVHGVIVNSHLWRHQLAGLSAVRRCIAVDLMGHGATSIAADQDVSFEAQARMLAEVMDALDLDKVDLVANDSGTGIAQIFTANHPERLRSLVLTNGDVHDNWPPKDFSGFLSMVAAGGLEDTLRGMAEDKARFRGPDGLGGAYEQPEKVSDETIDVYLQPLLTDPARLHDLERFILAFDNRQTVGLVDKLKKLDVPTLVVWGTGDIFFGVEWSRWLEQTIPGVKQRLELEGGRLFLPEERAAEVNAAVLSFWKQHAPLSGG
ncbi:alpha/beta fold hydrolase [Hyphomicrobium sp.]|uniref:alpha/beta fold hydrolase n=1 Tax=Hyphomicrobium sp. TaxID=82 RepID=UPI002FE3F400